MLFVTDIITILYKCYRNVFSFLKSKLQKKQGLYYEDLNNNIKKIINTCYKKLTLIIL